jgi:hypothetical protein
MNIKTNLKRIWAAVAVLSLGVLIYAQFAEESWLVLNALLVLDAAMLLIALPCSLFGGAVVFFAWYVLEMNPLSLEGAYLNTVVLFLLGTVQWFWISRFWYPTETPFQKLDLVGANPNS